MKSVLADDTNLFLIGDALKEVRETMPFDYDKLSTWFQAHILSIHVYNTNFVIFSNTTYDDN